MENENLQNLASFIVTATGFSFLSDGRRSIGIIESDSIVKLDTDILPCHTFPIETGMHFRMGDRDLVIKEIQKETIVMEDETRMSKTGFLLALNRNKVKVAHVNTIESILQDL